MESFEFYNPVKVFFGKGVRKEIGSRLRGLYKNVLIVCSKGPFHENGLYDEIKMNLENNGMRIIAMGDIPSNPKLANIREGVGLCKQENVDLVLALGAGSAIDATKGISAAAAMGVDPYELYWGSRVNVDKAIDTVMIPTFAATGSEMNRSSVAVNEESKEKYFFDSFHAKMVFMDPEIHVTVPVKLSIWGIMDILSHTFEYYFNGYMKSEFQLNLSESIIKSVMGCTERIIKDPSDVEARGEIMWAAAMTWGTGLTWIGRGVPDMACHGIEESFSAFFDTHHGACLGVLTPRWMDVVSELKPEIFARFARRVMGLIEGDDMKAARKGVILYKHWLKSINAPNTFFDLANLAFADEDLDRVARTACKVYNGGVGHLVHFDYDQIFKLLKSGKIAY